MRDPSPLIEKVYAYVAYRLGDGADAEDVTSATFERALRYRKSFDPHKGEPVAWLVGIARRCIADSKSGGEVPTAALPDTPADGPEEGSLRRLALRAAVRQLDERERELIGLRYGADLTSKQIAEVLELSPEAARVALHRALVRLRGLLDEEPTGVDTRSGRSCAPRFSDL